jgi:hypothetical protein
MNRLFVICMIFVAGVACKGWSSVGFSSFGSCNQSSVTTLTCTASMTFANRDFVILFASEHGSGFIYSVSDSCDQTWVHQPAASFTQGSAIQIDAWTVASAVAGSCSITVTRSPTANSRFQWVAANYSGVTSFAATTSGANNTSSSCSISLTTQSNNNVVVAGFATYAHVTYTPNTGYLRGQDTNIAAASALSDNTTPSPDLLTNTVNQSLSRSCIAGAIELVAGARTDRVLTTMPSVPPQAGSNTCSSGSLNWCGNLIGTNTVMTDPLYNNIKIIRATDYSDSATIGGGQCCQVGPGGSAEEHVWSSDDEVLEMGTSGGGCRMRTFDPVALQVGAWVTSGVTSPSAPNSVWKCPGFGEFSYVTAGNAHLLVNGQVQLFSIVTSGSGSGMTGTVIAGPTIEADFSYAIPCWQNSSSCLDWTPGIKAAGTNLMPLTNNFANHIFQLMGSSGCTSGGNYPAFNSSSSSELAMINDGTCTWLDIGPANTYTWSSDGGVSTTDDTWSAGLANHGGQGEDGSIFVVQYNASTGTYYHLNTATGNAYSFTCTAGVGYNCSGGTFAESYIGNIIPGTEDLVLIHNTKTGKNGSWLTIGPQTCAFSNTNCPYDSGGAAYFWQVGTTHVVFLEALGISTPGHHMTGYNTFVAGNSISPYFFHSVYLPESAVTGVFDFTLPTCNPSACPADLFDQHGSWVDDNATDTAPFCSSALSNNYGEYPPQYPYQDEIFCVAMDGSGTVWREGLEYSTGGNAIFNAWANIGSLSSDMEFWAGTSDWWNTLGNTSGGSTVMGGFNWQPDTVYAAGTLISPATNNGPVLAAQVFMETKSTCTSAASAPAWSSTDSVDDGTCSWIPQGKNNGNESVFIYQLQ